MDKLTVERFSSIAAAYPRLRIAVVGDLCLDRYLEIDPALQEVSIETGKPVHNVVRVRSQPGGAGTILNNLVALGVGQVVPVSFVGLDGEGYELRRALESQPRVRLDYVVETSERRTFTYCKPLVLRPGEPPEELNRLDTKNWTPTPEPLEEQLAAHVRTVGAEVDGIILLEQVERLDTGVLTRRVLREVAEVTRRRPDLPVIADSRRSLADYPPVCLKMNRAELARLAGIQPEAGLEQVREAARELAGRRGRTVFVTLAEDGLAAATPDGDWFHVPALPIRGPIDIVGAGDAVTANLMSALAAGASVSEALQAANLAASIVIHQVGTTGTASVPDILQLLERIHSTKG